MTMGRPKCEGLTRRQAEAMQEISRYVKVNGMFPSMQELAERLGIAAPSVYVLIQSLLVKGYLAKTESARRPYEILKKVETESLVKTSIPLLGVIPCGVPVEPVESTDGDHILIDASFRLGNDVVYALRLDGQSMIELGYEPQDIVVVKCQPVAANGDIVAAMVNGGATLKRLIYTPDRIALKAENSSFKPIEISPHDDFRILGKVIMHIKEKDIDYGRE